MRQDLTSSFFRVKSLFVLSLLYYYYYSTANISNLVQLPQGKLDLTQWLLLHPLVNPGDFLFLK